MNNIWRKTYWYCNWYFGRDDYETKTVIQEWVNWVVTIDSDDNVSFCKFKSETDKQEKLLEREKDNN